MTTGVDVPHVLQVRYEYLRVEHVPFLIWTLLGTSQQIGATRRTIGIAANPLQNCRVVHVWWKVGRRDVCRWFLQPFPCHHWCWRLEVWKIHFQFRGLFVHMLDVFHSRDVCSTLLAGGHGKRVRLGGIPSHQRMHSVAVVPKNHVPWHQGGHCLQCWRWSRREIPQLVVEGVARCKHHGKPLIRGLQWDPTAHRA